MFVGFGFGMDESSVCVYGCVGFVYRFLLLVIFIMFFKYMILMWFDMCFIIDRLCVMNKYVMFVFFWMFCSMFMICVWIEILSVEIGLLYRIKFGFIDSVCVMLMCCF